MPRTRRLRVIRRAAVHMCECYHVSCRGSYDPNIVQNSHGIATSAGKARRLGAAEALFVQLERDVNHRQWKGHFEDYIVYLYEPLKKNALASTTNQNLLLMLEWTVKLSNSRLFRVSDEQGSYFYEIFHSSMKPQFRRIWINDYQSN